MNLTSKDIVPITTARARLTELADEVAKSGEPKLITKNGESYVALITAEQLDELRRFQLAEADPSCERPRKRWKTSMRDG